MSDIEFAHLHVHSEYSMLDGAIRLKELAKRAKALGQKAIALTDHGNMHGTLQFVGACKDEGLLPVVGCEVNLVAGSRKEKGKRPHTHFVLHADNMGLRRRRPPRSRPRRRPRRSTIRSSTEPPCVSSLRMASAL